MKKTIKYFLKRIKNNRFERINYEALRDLLYMCNNKNFPLYKKSIRILKEYYWHY